MRRSRTLAAVLAAPVVLACAWLAGAWTTDLLVGEGAGGRLADRALLDLSVHYGVGNGPWEYTGPPLVFGWRVQSAEACGSEEGAMAPGRYRAEVEGYSLFGVPRGAASWGCGGDNDSAVRWKPYF